MCAQIQPRQLRYYCSDTSVAQSASKSRIVHPPSGERGSDAA